MRNFFGIIVCVLLFGASLQAADTPIGKDSTPEYGTKTAATITVTVTGAVRRAGIYYMARESTLLDAMNQSEWLKSTNGKVEVSRIVNGKAVKLDITIEDRTFKLLDGDKIHIGSIMDDVVHQ